MDAFGLVHVIGEILDDAAHRGNTGAARDDDKLLVSVLVKVEAIAVGPADIDLIADIVVEDLIRDVADLADGEVQQTRRDAADGDGRFTVLRDGDLEELAGLDTEGVVIGKAEGPLVRRVADDFLYLGENGDVVIIRHLRIPPSWRRRGGSRYGRTKCTRGRRRRSARSPRTSESRCAC